MSDVFYALADPVRRRLLERLQADRGQTIRQLRARTTMSRQGLAKHLAVLEAAGLVVVKRVKREKLHFINTAPMTTIVLRWLVPFVPEAKREAAEPKAAPVARGRGRRNRASESGHGLWDPGREVPTFDAAANRQAEIRERLRMRDA